MALLRKGLGELLDRLLDALVDAGEARVERRAGPLQNARPSGEFAKASRLVGWRGRTSISSESVVLNGYTESVPNTFVFTLVRPVDWAESMYARWADAPPASSVGKVGPDRPALDRDLRLIIGRVGGGVDHQPVPCPAGPG